jgi:hypothetical protein
VNHGQGGGGEGKEDEKEHEEEDEVEGDKDRGAIAAWAALHGPGGPSYLELLSDVDVIISARPARETMAQDEGGSEKKGKGGGGSKPKQPRVRAKAKERYRDPKRRLLLPPLAVGRLEFVCESERPHCSSLNARIRLYF